jgi:hypothetical protein
MEKINKMSDEIKQKTTLEEIKQRGGLAFPLDYEDISVLDATYIGAYIVTLQNGAAVIYDPKVKTTSVVIATHRTFTGATVGLLSAYTDNGVIYIQSTTTDDNSQINVLCKY